MGARTKVLVVDDEPEIRHIFGRLLASCAEVETAEHGAEAIEMVKRGSFDAILTDVMMPCCSGIELLAWLREHRPELADHTVVISGAMSPESAQALEDVPLYQKPLTRTELLAALDDAIAGRSLPAASFSA